MADSNPISIVAILATMGGVAGSFAIIAWGGKDSDQSPRQRIATLIASAAGGFLVGLPLGVRYGIRAFNIRSPSADELTIYSFAAVVGASVFIMTFLVGGMARGASGIKWGDVFWHFIDGVRPSKRKDGDPGDE